ncbi:MAG TPA: glycosyltransferase [Pyrinomonadaceae bacterium]|nr:glycosyltransferase [Pyrinomonadaceae bacterium]
MRFQKVTTTDYSYLQPFLAEYPHYKQLSYREFWALYQQRCSGWHNNFSAHLPKLGYEAQDICVNFEYLQKLWAKENGVSYDNDNWLKDIATAQIKAFRPDVMFLDDLYVTDAAFRQFLREVSPTPVKLIGWRAAPTEDYSVLRDLDLVLTCTSHFAKQMQDHGVNARVLLHGFEPAILKLIPPGTERTLDFTFMGSLILENGFHNQRFQLVKSLMEKTNLEVWGRLSERNHGSRSKQLASRVTFRANRLLRQIDAPDQLIAKLNSFDERYQRGPLTRETLRKHPGRFHPPVIALDYFELLAKSRINLNNHIDCAAGYAGNIRLFEVTGVGACLMTDWMINVPEMFEDGVEVVTYKNADECVEKVNYLLDHPQELASIAAAGQRRTLRDHTYVNRAEQLNEIVKELVSSR